MAYTTTPAQSNFLADHPTPVRVLSGAPATADSGLPTDQAKMLRVKGFNKLRLGLVLDGGSSPTATILLYQFVPSLNSWLLLDTQTAKTSGHTWTVDTGPGLYYPLISALANSPTDVAVTAQPFSRF